MSFLTVALTAATPLTVITGNAYIHRITIKSATPSVVSLRDSIGNAVTMSMPSYAHRTLTSGVSGTSVNPACNGIPEQTVNTVGATDVSATVAANASYPLPVLASVADGCCCDYTDLVFKLGVTCTATADATAIIEYNTNLP